MSEELVPSDNLGLKCDPADFRYWAPERPAPKPSHEVLPASSPD